MLYCVWWLWSRLFALVWRSRFLFLLLFFLLLLQNEWVEYCIEDAIVDVRARWQVRTLARSLIFSPPFSVVQQSFLSYFVVDDKSHKFVCGIRSEMMHHQQPPMAPGIKTQLLVTPFALLDHRVKNVSHCLYEYVFLFQLFMCLGGLIYMSNQFESLCEKRERERERENEKYTHSNTGFVLLFFFYFFVVLFFLSFSYFHIVFSLF